MHGLAAPGRGRWRALTASFWLADALVLAQEAMEGIAKEAEDDEMELVLEQGTWKETLIREIEKRREKMKKIREGSLVSKVWYGRPDADHPINIPKKLEEEIESTWSAPALARTAHTCYAVLPEHYANALVSGPCITT